MTRNDNIAIKHWKGRLAEDECEGRHTYDRLYVYV
jgi:hypothetical protein